MEVREPGPRHSIQPTIALRRRRVKRLFLVTRLDNLERSPHTGVLVPMRIPAAHTLAFGSIPEPVEADVALGTILLLILPR
jgi:hypothetical protein